MGFIARRVAKRAEQYKSVDDYLKDLWRPLMAWVYAVTVMFDFVLAPILLGIYTVATGQKYIQWQPLTIQGGGMFHIAMGAVIGVSSYSHSQEKINGGATDGGSNFPGLPSGWDPATVKAGPLIPEYVPPTDEDVQQYSSKSATPAESSVSVTVTSPVSATTATETIVESKSTIVPISRQPSEKTATGFPKAKRF
jgi:hypothetical protein